MPAAPYSLHKMPVPTCIGCKSKAETAPAATRVAWGSLHGADRHRWQLGPGGAGQAFSTRACSPVSCWQHPLSPPGGSRRFPDASPQEEPHHCLSSSAVRAQGHLWSQPWLLERGRICVSPSPVTRERKPSLRCKMPGRSHCQVSPRLYSHLTEICQATSIQPQCGALSNANWEKLCDSTCPPGKNQPLSHRASL